MSHLAEGGARSEGHITITENRAISVTARLHAILCLGGVTPKLGREGAGCGKTGLDPTFWRKSGPNSSFSVNHAKT